MVLYSYFRSSASYRVRIALNLKGIAYEYKAVHLLNDGGGQHKDEYSKLNPSHEVPTLVHNGKALGQSVAIIDYLDHVKQDPSLFPADPYMRAVVLQACEIINSGGQPLGNLRVLQEMEKRFGATEAQKNDWVAHWVEYSARAYNDLVKSRAGKFSFGDQPSAADCFLIPHLVNADRFKVNLADFPVLARIRANCEGLEAFRKAGITVQPDSPKS